MKKITANSLSTNQLDEVAQLLAQFIVDNNEDLKLEDVYDAIWEYGLFASIPDLITYCKK